MNEVIRAAAALQAVFLDEKWRFCFIGGQPEILDVLERRRAKLAG